MSAYGTKAPADSMSTHPFYIKDVCSLVMQTIKFEVIALDHFRISCNVRYERTADIANSVMSESTESW